MKKLIGLFLLVLGLNATISAQSYTNLVGQKTPPLIIEKWISPVPEFANKFVIVDFWATWCGPCRMSMPHMNALAAKFAKEIIIIGLSKETEATVRGFKGMEYYSAIDTKGRLQSAVGVRAIPNVMIINPSGIVCWQGHPASLTDQILDELLQNYNKSQKENTTGSTPQIVVRLDDSIDYQIDNKQGPETEEDRRARDTFENE